MSTPKNPWEGKPPRDPARIRRMLDKIETLWRQYPDMRLGQLLSNIDSSFERATFTHEDDVLEAHLDVCLKTERTDP